VWKFKEDCTVPFNMSSGVPKSDGSTTTILNTYPEKWPPGLIAATVIYRTDQNYYIEGRLTIRTVTGQRLPREAEAGGEAFGR